MSQQKDVIDQLEAAMDQLIQIATRMQHLVEKLPASISTKMFVERYIGLSQQLKEMEKVLHDMGLDKNSEQFFRIEAKLKAFANESELFLRSFNSKK